MPELPEVETTAADLRPHLLGARFTGAHVLWARTVAFPDPETLAQELVGQEVVGVGRRGKFVLIHLASGATLVVHLRMTGRLRVEPAGSEAANDRHVRAWFELADSRMLVFTDQRKFGRVWLVPDVTALLARLGPEPLTEAFDVDALAAKLKRRKAAIKGVLLDQHLIAGVGNIYANEALFMAGIHPARPADSLTEDELFRLVAAIRQVLREAIGARGTTLRDYRPPFGEQGEYQFVLRVHDRAGEPCRVCGTPVEYAHIAQRGTYWCGRCQG